MLSPAFEEWVIRPSDLQACQKLAEGLRLHPITAAVLVARGVRSRDDAAAVLLDEGAVRLDPFLLTGMEPAVDRIHRAVVTGERVLIYGDYDVDGTSATVLYVRFLNALGLAPDFYIPHRLREGYGLNADAIRRIAARVVRHNHLKLMVRGSRGPVLTAFGYGMGTPPEFWPADAIDVAGSLEINSWNGTEGVQLRLRDLRSSCYGEIATC
jgi:hypothetical protein